MDEREFFFLAGTWLGYRLEAMGGKVVSSPGWTDGQLEYMLLGMVDQAEEMKLMVREALG